MAVYEPHCTIQDFPRPIDHTPKKTFRGDGAVVAGVGCSDIVIEAGPHLPTPNYRQNEVSITRVCGYPVTSSARDTVE